MRAIAAGLLLVGAPTVVADTQAPVDALLACRTIAAGAERLACFDRESERLAAALRPAPAVVVAAPASPAPSPASASAAVARESPAGAAPASAPAGTPPAPAPRLSAEQSFGLAPAVIRAREADAGAPRDASEIRARLVGLGQHDDGRVVFTLDNGQVWRQLLPAGDLLARLGQAVTVRRGVLGSFLLRAASGRECKVVRVE